MQKKKIHYQMRRQNKRKKYARITWNMGVGSCPITVLQAIIIQFYFISKIIFCLT